MTNIVWVKPNGTEITTNDTDASIDAAVGLGWKKKKGEQKPKRGRPAKSEG